MCGINFDRVFLLCLGFFLKYSWFTFAPTEISGGASSALLNKGIEILGGSSRPTGTRSFKRCCTSLDGFIQLTHRIPHERDARFLQITIQRPVGLTSD